jgi:hypothetical protein
MKVMMFQGRFEALIAEGRKLQTIRPFRRNPLKVGEELSLRVWTGKPYRSPQREIAQVVVARVRIVQIEADRVSVWIPEGWRPIPFPREFAKSDGFGSWEELAAWFAEAHGLPFEGTLIEWRAL